MVYILICGNYRLIFLISIVERNIEILVVEQEDLSEDLKIIDKEIEEEAFSEILNVSDKEKEEIHEKYITNPWKYIFAKIKDEFVGRVVLDKRDIKLEKENLMVVGIGGLAIKKAFQKQGIGKSLVNQSISLCKKNNIDILFLNAGEKLQGYYEKFGFEMYKYKFTGRSGKEYMEEEGMFLVLNKKTEKLLHTDIANIGLGNV